MDKISWIELEKLGLDEQCYENCAIAMNNIELMHNEACEIFERIYDGEDVKIELRNLIQLCSMLNSEIETATKNIDEAIDFADEITKK